MNQKRGLVLLIALVLVAVPVLAEGEGAPEGMTPEMMETMMKAGTPNEHHEHLAKLAGVWTVKLKMWMDPEGEPMEMTGKSTNEMIFGGRYLQQHYESTWMGQPFVGMGLEGYDNIVGQHVGMWIDNAGTMLTRFVGDCTEGGKIIKTTAEMTDAMSGERTMTKSKTTLVSDSEFTYESWHQGTDGEFYKSMEITYTK